MPWSLVGRSGSMAVSLLSQAHAESFSLGLGSFVNEARLLTRFDRPSLVKVHRYLGGQQHGLHGVVVLHRQQPACVVSPHGTDARRGLAAQP